MSGLNQNQRRFVEEYLIDLNASRAYRVAYPDASSESARRLASLLLTNVDVDAAIQEAIKKRSERTEIDQDRVLLEIARIAFHDPRRAFDSNGWLKAIQDWPDDVAAAVSSIKVRRIVEDQKPVEVAEIKFWDKGKFVEMAGRHVGAFEADNKQKGAITVVLDQRDSEL